MATPGTSVRLKRLRQRFGIRAHKVSIRTHVPWHWRALATVAIATVTLVLAALIFDAGRGISLFQSGTSTKETESLKARVTELELELGKVRSVADSSDSTLRMERAALEQLAKQVASLEAENSSLKQDLAFFESMGAAQVTTEETGVNISRLKIDPENGGAQYRYRMLIVQKGGRQAKEFKGSLQLLVKVRQNGEDAMISLPSAGEAQAAQYRLDVRYFQRAEGTFVVPAGAVVLGVEARLLQGGAVRARQSVTL